MPLCIGAITAMAPAAKIAAPIAAAWKTFMTFPPVRFLLPERPFIYQASEEGDRHSGARRKREPEIRDLFPHSHRLISRVRVHCTRPGMTVTVSAAWINNYPPPAKSRSRSTPICGVDARRRGVEYHVFFRRYGANHDPPAVRSDCPNGRVVAIAILPLPQPRRRSPIRITRSKSSCRPRRAARWT